MAENSSIPCLLLTIVYVYLCVKYFYIFNVFYACKYMCAVKPPNKGHIGDNINSHALSLVERLSSSQRFKLYCYYIYIGKQNFRVPAFAVLCIYIERFIIQCPFLGGST